MSRLIRKLAKFALYLFIFAILCLCLDIAVLAYPAVAFPEKIQKGNLTFYSDKPFDSELAGVIDDVIERLEAIEIYDPALKLDTYLCRNPKIYGILARLSMVPPAVPGFNLSIVGNSFVSLTGLEDRYRRNRGLPRFSSIGGDPAQNIAHELIHNYCEAKSGYFNYRNLPTWKSEGYAEFAAGYAASRGDSTATLLRRIINMKNLPLDNRGREYYKWGLMVEFLAVNQSLTYREVMSDSIYLDSTYKTMMNWLETSNDNNLQAGLSD